MILFYPLTLLYHMFNDEYRNLIFHCLYSSACSTNMAGTCCLPVTKGHSWHIGYLSLFVMDEQQVCAPSPQILWISFFFFFLDPSKVYLLVRWYCFMCILTSGFVILTWTHIRLNGHIPLWTSMTHKKASQYCGRTVIGLLHTKHQVLGILLKDFISLRATRAILGLFVLIWIQFSHWFQVTLKNCKSEISLTKQCLKLAIVSLQSCVRSAMHTLYA